MSLTDFLESAHLYVDLAALFPLHPQNVLTAFFLMSYLHFLSCNLRCFPQIEGKCIILMLSCYRLSTLGCPSLIMMSTTILLFSTLLGLYQQRELLWGKHYLKKYTLVISAGLQLYV